MIHTASDVRKHDMVRSYYMDQNTIPRIADRAAPIVVYEQFLHNHPQYIHKKPVLRLDGPFNTYKGEPVFEVSGHWYNQHSHVGVNTTSSSTYLPMNAAYGHH